MADKYITSEEFNRYMDAENNFRNRLEKRMAADHKVVREDLQEIKGLVKETNGRVLEAEKTIGILRRDVEAMKSEENEIERTVHSIRDDGCNQYKEHRAILESGGDVAAVVPRPQFRLDHFSAKQKAIAGAGIALVMWPAIQEIASVVHELILWLGKRP